MSTNQYNRIVVFFPDAWDASAFIDVLY